MQRMHYRNRHHYHNPRTPWSKGILIHIFLLFSLKSSQKTRTDWKRSGSLGANVDKILHSAWSKQLLKRLQGSRRKTLKQDATTVHNIPSLHWQKRDCYTPPNFPKATIHKETQGNLTWEEPRVTRQERAYRAEKYKEAATVKLSTSE